MLSAVAGVSVMRGAHRERLALVCLGSGKAVGSCCAGRVAAAGSRGAAIDPRKPSGYEGWSCRSLAASEAVV